MKEKTRKHLEETMYHLRTAIDIRSDFTVNERGNMIIALSQIEDMLIYGSGKDGV